MRRFSCSAAICLLVCAGCASRTRTEGRTNPGGNAAVGSGTEDTRSSGLDAHAQTALSGGEVIWEQGATYLYELESKMKMSLGGLSSFDFVVSGQAAVQVIQREGAKAVLRLAIPDAVVSSRVKDASLEKSISEVRGGSCLIFLANGALERIGFPRGMSGSAATILRQVASAVQVTRAPEGRQRYVAEEYDTSGKYAAEYLLMPGSLEVRKTKSRYVSLLGSPVMPDGRLLQMVPEVLSSEGHIVLSPEGRLEELGQKEELRMKGAQTPVHSLSSFSMKLKSVSEKEGGWDWEALGNSHTLVAAGDPYAANSSQQSLNHAKIGGARFHQITERLAKNALKSKVKANENGKQAQERAFKEEAELFSALVGVLREDPKAADQAVQQIEANSPISQLLIDALGSASTPETERALVGLGIHSKDSGRRVQILHAIARMPRPGAGAVALMKSILETDPYNPRALYALGTYSRHFRDDGNSEMAAELGQYLVEKLRKAPGPSGRLTSLRAISNSGYSAALPEVRGYTSDGDETIRATAMRALQSMKVPEADEILALTMSSDSSVEVRIAAIEAARVREPTEKLVSAIIAAFHHADPTVRFRAVETALRWLPRRPGLRPMLQKVSQEDPEPRIRNLAKSV